ncbi:MAG: GGDEF domain-containing phosphodiesterase [Desulfovibrio sp.]|uniref:EAL domain-containing protein n=1 Tax=Desulfovibrio sp. TaxID=885 RepID=UPI0039E2C3E5
MHFLEDGAGGLFEGDAWPSDPTEGDPGSEINLKSWESCQIRRLLSRMEQYDRTTWLMQYESFLQQALRVVRTECLGRRFGILHADMQGFQVLNRIYGERAGNSMLRAFAAFLRRCDSYVCGSRVFADQFAMLFTIPPDISLQGMAKKLVSEGEQFLAEKRNLHPRSHLAFVGGICAVEGTPESLHPLVSRADKARRDLKPTLRSRCGIFTEAMEVCRLQRQSLYEDIAKALESRGVFFLLQPQIDIATGTVVGAEALARMRTPDGKIIMPDSFVPLLEESGDITSLDFTIYGQVCKHMQRRQQSGKPLVPVSLNISREHFRNPTFVSEFHSLVQAHDLAPRWVGLEITESVFVKKLEEISESVRQLKQFGYSIWLDDFGAGYSSLNVLKDVPFDFIKIDRGLLGTGEIAPTNKSIINSVVRLAEDLNMGILCEGVENASQRDFLSRLGRIQAQGFYYAHPMSLEDFEHLLDSGRKFHPLDVENS